MIPRALRGPIAFAIAAALPTTPPAAAQAPTDIHLVEIEAVDGTLAVRGEPRAVTDRAGYDNQPQFTSDGGLLYTSIRDGQADTWRYDLATGATEPVTRTPESEYSPTPVPGSDRFSVVRVEADSTQRLWSFRPDGSGAELVLPDVAPVGYHAWLDGAVALFVLGDPFTLQIAEPGPGPARTVAEGIGRSLQPAPGGTVSFTRQRDDRWEIATYDPDGDSVRVLAPLLGPDEYHAWLPDGTLLTAHGSELFALDPGSGEWVAFADLADAGIGPVTRIAVGPDGRWLAVVADRPEADPDSM